MRVFIPGTRRAHRNAPRRPRNSSMLRQWSAQDCTLAQSSDYAETMEQSAIRNEDTMTATITSRLRAIMLVCAAPSPVISSAVAQISWTTSSFHQAPSFLNRIVQATPPTTAIGNKTAAVDAEMLPDVTYALTIKQIIRIIELRAKSRRLLTATSHCLAILKQHPRCPNGEPNPCSACFSPAAPSIVPGVCGIACRANSSHMVRYCRTTP